MNRHGLARVGLGLGLLLAASYLGGCDCSGDTVPPGDLDAGDATVGGDASGDDAAASDASADAARGDAGCVASTETCNAIDDDCDGNVDEHVVRACGSDVGECVAGIETCSDGSFEPCVGEIVPATEVCNGLDDDCNGSIDEGCPCTDGDTQSCGSDVGECVPGVQTCAGSVWGACVGEVGAATEVCNGLDDDCDGSSDELFVDLGLACDGADADACAEGVRVCSADGSATVCDDATGDTAETCNGLDDDCDGTTDEGCTCTDGATQPCGSSVGACMQGTQTCAGGAWGACVGEVRPATESCNGADDDCDAVIDETFVLGGACDGADADLCAEGTVVCSATGGTTCSDTTGDSVEACNASDDDCDGATDEGFSLGTACDGPDSDLCAEGVLACDASGGASCNDATGDSVEVCNGVDDDCDGSVDEGNPGGGVICPGAVDVGACISRTACVAGAIICRGTFVAPTGAPTNPGTPTAPLASIAAAIANAGILGGGADVCVCDTSAAGPSTFTEDVTMVEGTSVLGGYDCTTWAVTAGRTTAIQDVDADGVSIPAGITSVTALDRMTVIGFNAAGATSSTAAVTVTNSSPTLSGDTVRAGNAATAIGLRVVETGSAVAAPIVTGGAYSASGIAGGTAIAVSLEGSSPRFNMVAIGGAGAGGVAATATTAYGVRCVDCGGTTFTGGSVATSGATTTGYGLHGSGDLTGFAATGTSFGGGLSGSSSTTTGVRLESCTGAPAFTTCNTNGGGNIGAVTATTRIAFSSSGASCAPVIDGGRHVGCELGVDCTGIECTGSSACVVRNATAIAGTVGTADTSFGMRCLSGGCASVTSSAITAGNLSRSGPIGIGLEIDGASPTVDDCAITGPNGGAIAVTGSRWYGLYLRATTSTVSNCIVASGTHAQPQDVVRYDQTSAGPALRAPTIVNDTIEYASCLACGGRTGLAIFTAPGSISGPSGIVRNNIIRHVGVGGATNPVVELNAQSDLQLFENNALWDPTASGGGVYVDEGTMPLSTAAQINALAGAAMNQVVDCMPNATWHIPAGSMCRNRGTMASCPATDFDGQRRPNESACDIGADEYYP